MSASGSATAATPEVSVVVVAWRARDDVLRCLESLERHAGLQYEAIVVDDGSGDGTAEAVAARFPDAILVAKQSRPDVSVIVVAFDVSDEVLACLESIAQHAGGVTAETILVDNGSRDGTAEEVERRFPDITAVRLARNEGISARNHGLRRATGRLRMFLDSDALLTPGALPELVRFLDETPGVGLAGPRLVYTDGTL